MTVRMRHTSSHSKNRRSHHALKNRVVVTDKDSGAPRLPHRLDESTGMYRGKLIAPKKAKAEKVTKTKAVKKVEEKAEEVKKEEKTEDTAK